MGIFCDNCMNEHKLNGIECFKCSTKFIPTNDKLLFCSRACSNTRNVTEEHKQKTRITFCKKLNYYDDSGQLLDSIEKLRSHKLNRQKNKRRENGIDEREKLTYDMINLKYADKDCVLLTTEEEFNKLKLDKKVRRIKFTIKSSCGHIMNDSLYYVFLENGTGIKCKRY